MTVAIAFVLMQISACGGAGSGGEDKDTAGDLVYDQTGDVGVPGAPYALAPPELVLDTFTAVLETSATTGLIDQTFDLTVRLARGEPAGDVSYSWDTGEGVAGGEGSQRQISFDTAGVHLVSVVVTDSEGNETSAGVALVVEEAGVDFLIGDVDGDGEVAEEDVTLVVNQLDGGERLSPEQWERADVDLDDRLTYLDVDLIQNAVDEGTDAPVWLFPEDGALGRVVRMIHPALLDPSSRAEVVFGETALVPMRGMPGYATFVVPPQMDTPGTVALVLRTDGETAATFDFLVLPLPAASEVPGEKLVRAMDDLDELFQAMPGLLNAYMEGIGASEEEKAALLGMMEMARTSYTAHKDRFFEAFEMMEPEGRAAFEQLALSNGLDEMLERIDLAMTQVEASRANVDYADSISVGAAAMVMDALCAALNIADIAEKMSDINETASEYLGWFDWWPLKAVPIVGQVISFLSNMSNAIGALTDIIGAVAAYLPEFGDMEMEVTPTALDLGQSSALALSVEIKIGSKICNNVAGDFVEGLMDKIQTALTKSLAKSIPLAHTAFRRAKYKISKMGTITKLIYKAVSGIAGAILDAVGIQGLLESLAEKVCDMIDDPNLPLDPGLIEASCGDGGATWTCTIACVGAVAFNAEKEICGDKKKASAGVECKHCAPDNCTGCCDAETCLLFAQQSDAKCGAGGAPCAPCPEHHECKQGDCVCTSDCQTQGELKCVANAIWICNQIVDAPPCLKWQLLEPCINGAECINGKCEGGCNAGNCPGCCLADGTCIDPTSDPNCGKNGETCVYCVHPEKCVNGECVCVPECNGKDCGDDGCEGSCGECPDGHVCVNWKCEALCGNGQIDPGEDCEVDGDCPEGQTCTGCKCGEAGKECKCDDPGVFLDGSECEWSDTYGCGEWGSVCHESGEGEDCHLKGD